MQNTYLYVSINLTIGLKALLKARGFAEQMPALLVRYGELGLKSPSVRRRFENALIDDIRRRHTLAELPCVISSTRGRVFVDSDDWRRSCEILTRTFGVVSFSPVTEVDSRIESVTKGVVEFARPLLFDGASFAIRTRRTGNHDYTSQTLAVKLGSEVLASNKDRGIKVSLSKPDVELFVEVREKKTYLYSSVLAGPGGMPLGTQGKMLSIVDSERGIASSWLMMKRGCTVLISADDSGSVRPLENWCPNLKTVAREHDIFELAKKNDCIGIALAWTMKEIERSKPPKGDLPVFYPLVGMNEEETRSLLDRIKA
jgi:thiamine biosynthesis protein ThiI